MRAIVCSDVFTYSAWVADSPLWQAATDACSHRVAIDAFRLNTASSVVDAADHRRQEMTQLHRLNPSSGTFRNLWLSAAVNSVPQRLPLVNFVDPNSLARTASTTYGAAGSEGMNLASLMTILELFADNDSCAVGFMRDLTGRCAASSTRDNNQSTTSTASVDRALALAIRDDIASGCAQDDPPTGVMVVFAFVLRMLDRFPHIAEDAINTLLFLAVNARSPSPLLDFLAKTFFLSAHRHRFSAVHISLEQSFRVIHASRVAAMQASECEWQPFAPPSPLSPAELLATASAPSAALVMNGAAAQRQQYANEGRYAFDPVMGELIFLRRDYGSRMRLCGASVGSGYEARSPRLTTPVTVVLASGGPRSALGGWGTRGWSPVYEVPMDSMASVALPLCTVTPLHRRKVATAPDRRTTATEVLVPAPPTDDASRLPAPAGWLLYHVTSLFNVSFSFLDNSAGPRGAGMSTAGSDAAPTFAAASNWKHGVMQVTLRYRDSPKSIVPWGQPSLRLLASCSSTDGFLDLVFIEDTKIESRKGHMHLARVPFSLVSPYQCPALNTTSALQFTRAAADVTSLRRRYRLHSRGLFHFSRSAGASLTAFRPLLASTVGSRLCTPLSSATIECWVNLEVDMAKTSQGGEPRTIFSLGDKEILEIFVDALFDPSIAPAQHGGGAAVCTWRCGWRAPKFGLCYANVVGSVGGESSSRWCHVAAVFNQGQCHLVVDGRCSAATAFPVLHLHSTAFQGPAIVDAIRQRGLFSWYVGKAFVGKISFLRVWDDAKANEQIQRERCWPRYGNEGGLVVCLDAADGAGRWLLDRGPHGLHARLPASNFVQYCSPPATAKSPAPPVQVAGGWHSVRTQLVPEGVAAPVLEPDEVANFSTNDVFLPTGTVDCSRLLATASTTAGYDSVFPMPRVETSLTTLRGTLMLAILSRPPPTGGGQPPHSLVTDVMEFDISAAQLASHRLVVDAASRLPNSSIGQITSGILSAEFVVIVSASTRTSPVGTAGISEVMVSHCVSVPVLGTYELPIGRPACELRPGNALTVVNSLVQQIGAFAQHTLLAVTHQLGVLPFLLDTTVDDLQTLLRFIEQISRRHDAEDDDGPSDSTRNPDPNLAPLLFLAALMTRMSLPRHRASTATSQLLPLQYAEHFDVWLQEAVTAATSPWLQPAATPAASPHLNPYKRRALQIAKCQSIAAPSRDDLRRHLLNVALPLQQSPVVEVALAASTLLQESLALLVPDEHVLGVLTRLTKRMMSQPSVPTAGASSQLRGGVSASSSPQHGAVEAILRCLLEHLSAPEAAKSLYLSVGPKDFRQILVVLLVEASKSLAAAMSSSSSAASHNTAGGLISFTIQALLAMQDVLLAHAMFSPVTVAAVDSVTGGTQPSSSLPSASSTTEPLSAIAEATAYVLVVVRAATQTLTSAHNTLRAAQSEASSQQARPVSSTPGRPGARSLPTVVVARLLKESYVGCILSRCLSAFAMIRQQPPRAIVEALHELRRPTKAVSDLVRAPSALTASESSGPDARLAREVGSWISGLIQALRYLTVSFACAFIRAPAQTAGLSELVEGPLFRRGFLRAGSSRDAAVRSLLQGLGPMARLLQDWQAANQSIGFEPKSASVLLPLERTIFCAFCNLIVPVSEWSQASSSSSSTPPTIRLVLEQVKNIRRWLLFARQGEKRTLDDVRNRAQLLCRVEPEVNVTAAALASPSPPRKGRAAFDNASSGQTPTQHGGGVAGASAAAAAGGSSSSNNGREWKLVFQTWKRVRRLRDLSSLITQTPTQLASASSATLLIQTAARFLQGDTNAGTPVPPVTDIEAYVLQRTHVAARRLSGLQSLKDILQEAEDLALVMPMVVKCLVGWHPLDSIAGCPTDVLGRVRATHFSLVTDAVSRCVHLLRPRDFLRSPWARAFIVLMSSPWGLVDFDSLGLHGVTSTLLRFARAQPTAARMSAGAPRIEQPSVNGLPRRIEDAVIDAAPSTVTVCRNGTALRWTAGRGTCRASACWNQRPITTPSGDIAPHRVYYFEMCIVELAPRGYAAIGVGPFNFNLARPPGSEPGSFALHGEDGTLLSETTTGQQVDVAFGVGDTVGCGLNAETHECFWTKNGSLIAAARCAGVTHDVYPLVALDLRGVVVLNFGQSPFLFDLAVVDPTSEPRPRLVCYQATDALINFGIRLARSAAAPPPVVQASFQETCRPPAATGSTNPSAINGGFLMPSHASPPRHRALDLFVATIRALAWEVWRLRKLPWFWDHVVTLLDLCRTMLEVVSLEERSGTVDVAAALLRPQRASDPIQPPLDVAGMDAIPEALAGASTAEVLLVSFLGVCGLRYEPRPQILRGHPTTAWCRIGHGPVSLVRDASALEAAAWRLFPAIAASVPVATANDIFALCVEKEIIRPPPGLRDDVLFAASSTPLGGIIALLFHETRRSFPLRSPAALSTTKTATAATTSSRHTDGVLEVEQELGSPGSARGTAESARTSIGALPSEDSFECVFVGPPTNSSCCALQRLLHHYGSVGEPGAVVTNGRLSSLVTWTKALTATISGMLASGSVFEEVVALTVLGGQPLSIGPGSVVRLHPGKAATLSSAMLEDDDGLGRMPHGGESADGSSPAGTVVINAWKQAARRHLYVVVDIDFDDGLVDLRSLIPAETSSPSETATFQRPASWTYLTTSVNDVRSIVATEEDPCPLGNPQRAADGSRSTVEVAHASPPLPFPPSLVPDIIRLARLRHTSYVTRSHRSFGAAFFASSLLTVLDQAISSGTQHADFKVRFSPATPTTSHEHSALASSVFSLLPSLLTYATTSTSPKGDFDPRRELEHSLMLSRFLVSPAFSPHQRLPVVDDLREVKAAAPPLRGTTPPSDECLTSEGRMRMAQQLAMRGFSLDWCTAALEEASYSRSGALRLLNQQRDELYRLFEGVAEEGEEDDEAGEDGAELDSTGIAAPEDDADDGEEEEGSDADGSSASGNDDDGGDGSSQGADDDDDDDDDEEEEGEDQESDAADPCDTDEDGGNDDDDDDMMGDEDDPLLRGGGDRRRRHSSSLRGGRRRRSDDDGDSQGNHNNRSDGEDDDEEANSYFLQSGAPPRRRQAAAADETDRHRSGGSVRRGRTANVNDAFVLRLDEDDADDGPLDTAVDPVAHEADGSPPRRRRRRHSSLLNGGDSSDEDALLGFRVGDDGHPTTLEGLASLAEALFDPSSLPTNGAELESQHRNSNITGLTSSARVNHASHSVVRPIDAARGDAARGGGRARSHPSSSNHHGHQGALFDRGHIFVTPAERRGQLSSGDGWTASAIEFCRAAFLPTTASGELFAELRLRITDLSSVARQVVLARAIPNITARSLDDVSSSEPVGWIQLELQSGVGLVLLVTDGDGAPVHHHGTCQWGPRMLATRRRHLRPASHRPHAEDAVRRSGRSAYICPAV